MKWEEKSISGLVVIVFAAGLCSTTASPYFETFFVEPKPLAENEPSRNALRLVAFKWPRAEVPYLFEEASYGKLYNNPGNHSVICTLLFACSRFPG